jgi:hypothetical protein
VRRVDAAGNVVTLGTLPEGPLSLILNPDGGAGIYVTVEDALLFGSPP